jgi:hypothetical protein
VYKGVTTYDFIVSEQKRQRELKQAKLTKKKQKTKKSANNIQATNPTAAPESASPLAQSASHVPEENIIINRNEVEMVSTAQGRGGQGGYQTINTGEEYPHGNERHGQDEEEGHAVGERYEEKREEGSHHERQKIVAFDTSCEECEAV